MLEELQRRYPELSNMPSESEIQAEVSKLFGVSRKRTITVDSGEPPKRRKTLHEYSAFLKDLVRANPRLMPMQAVPLLRRRFPESADILGDKKVRSKVSTIKRKVQAK